MKRCSRVVQFNTHYQKCVELHIHGNLTCHSDEHFYYKLILQVSSWDGLIAKDLQTISMSILSKGKVKEKIIPLIKKALASSGRSLLGQH